MTWKVLDLFSGAGGSAMGLHRAWPDAEIVGVDIKPQPHYPFTFVQGDALNPPFDLRKFDFIWASPPCQKFMSLQFVNRHLGHSNNHPDHIPTIRRMLIESGAKYVIENVISSPLQAQIILCGASLGLPELARHRKFESNTLLFQPPCTHRRSARILGVYGHKPDGHAIMRRKEYRITYAPKNLIEGQTAMGIDWMDWNELREAIPPAYSFYIARQIRQP